MKYLLLTLTALLQFLAIHFFGNTFLGSRKMRQQWFWHNISEGWREPIVVGVKTKNIQMLVSQHVRPIQAHQTKYDIKTKYLCIIHYLIFIQFVTFSKYTWKLEAHIFFFKQGCKCKPNSQRARCEFVRGWGVDLTREFNTALGAIWQGQCWSDKNIKGNKNCT